MRRRSKAGGKPVKTRGRKAGKLKRRIAPKAVGRRSSSTAGEETDVARLTRELTEAAEQHAATVDVLSVISRSTYDLQKVLDTLVETAARICGADMACIVRPQGSYVQFMATYGFSQAFFDIASSTPIAPGRWTLSGRVLADRCTVHIADVLADPEYTFSAAQKIAGFRSGLGVPLMREGAPIGVLNLWRSQVQPFTDKQIALVTSFAAQAVIAIENTRLLNELREALERQTATSEVLQIISSSPGDLQPVFAAMLENAVRICDAAFGNIYRWDGGVFSLAASLNTPTAFAEYRKRSPIGVGPATASGRMARPISTLDNFILQRKVVHVADLTKDQRYIEREPDSVASVELGGVRTVLAAPMLKENEWIGVLVLSRQEVRSFTDKQIALVQNFAAQAVIAIENTRLLKELRERTEEVEKLNQHLEQRVADQVGEIELT